MRVLARSRYRAWALFLGLLGSAGAISGCSTGATDEAHGSGGGPNGLTVPGTAVGSVPADARIRELRDRFRVEQPSLGLGSGGEPSATARPVIGQGALERFDRTSTGGLLAVPSAEPRVGLAEPVRVELPAEGSGSVRLTDASSGVAIQFKLEGAAAVPVAVAGGIALYAHALGNADVVHRAHAQGTEDYVVFEEPPARDELRYDVDVSSVAGLRLVSNTLEFLDEEGAPRLRVAPPFVVDAEGLAHAARLAIEGCAHDTNPAAPWGRTIPRPGATTCSVRVAWDGVTYPAIVDPAWTSTSNMVTARTGHTATMLGSGMVLIVGHKTVATAELYNPATASFAVTGAMPIAREGATATRLGSGKVLIAGGVGTGSAFPLASALLYDPSVGTFADTGSMVWVRKEHAASLLPSGQVLISGGYGAQGSNCTYSAELYDPATGTFALTGSMTKNRCGSASTLLGSGKVLITGGGSSPGTSGDVSAELYNPVSGTFTATGSMGHPYTGHTATLLGSGEVLVVGGFAELYDPTIGSFAPTGPMVAARLRGHTATLLGSGNVLIAGGFNDGASIASAELYRPGVNAFTMTGSMANSREGHSATLLGSGKVLVAGGYRMANKTQEAELYNLDQGLACAAPDDCASGFCVDGVCCDTECSGASFFCQACAAALKQSGTGDGVCGPAKDNTNPHNDGCMPDPSFPDNCGAPGKCNGSGQCRTLAVPGTVCGPASCAGAVVTGNVCNAGGLCVNGTASCGLYVCNAAGDDCGAICTGPADCAATAFCDTATQTCRLKNALGVTCSSGSECNSGYCFDGVCCNQACGGLCQACDIIPNVGGCVPFVGSPTLHGHPACEGTGDCQGQCDGSNAFTCEFPAMGTPCDAAASCSGDVSTPGSTCDGAGVCAAATSKNCPPYACDDGTGECKESCASDGDCAQGAVCDTVAGKCAQAAGTCADAFTGQGPNGELIPCSPYRCKNGACQQQCTGDADCADGFACGAGECAAVVDGDGGESGGGCGCKVVAPRERGGSLAILGLLAFVVRRRRGRARRSRCAARLAMTDGLCSFNDRHDVGELERLRSWRAR